MLHLRKLRRQHQLTLVDLARLSIIPARRLAAIEAGALPTPFETRQLALVFGVPYATFQAHPAPLLHQPRIWRAWLGVTLALVAAATSWAAPNAAGDHPVPQPVMQVAAAPLPATPPLPTSAGPPATPTVPPTAAPSTPTVAPTAPPAPSPSAAFVLTDAGPRGCPLAPQHGRVVLTQGYGVGTHAPAATWGAIDLAVDGNLDGQADPGATSDAPVVATHAGTVTVTIESWPAGNHVWVDDPTTGWRTGYSHLQRIDVSDGQWIEAGTRIGTAGSSGFSTGPHLDYQLWHTTRNIDPTTLIGCR